MMVAIYFTFIIDLSGNVKDVLKQVMFWRNETAAQTMRQDEPQPPRYWGQRARGAVPHPCTPHSHPLAPVSLLNFTPRL